MRLDQGDKVTAVYLWGVENNRWPDVVVLRPASDVDMSRPPSTQVGYVRADEAKDEDERLEKTILALVSYIERDGEMLRDVVPHFAQKLADMGLYKMETEENE